MPDINISCPDCGRKYRISEYATVRDLTCHTCGANLDLPNTGTSMGLRVRQTSYPPPISIPGAPALAVPAQGPVVHDAPMVDVHREEEIEQPSKWMSWVVMALVAGVLIGYQYKATEFGAYADYYTWLRNGLALAAYVLVVLMAFQDQIGPGIACLLFPPYILAYSGSSIESGVLRGLVFGVTLTLLAETFLIPDDALFMAFGDQFSQLVDTVDGLIVRASDSPLID